jgi:uncharacterized protein YndB with AHSA1/START domain
MNIETSSTIEPVVVMTRTFDAPREKVWAAFTDPKHVVHWYGGHGFSNPVCEMDVRPGGHWRHVMRTPDGHEFEMRFVFVEVVKPEKLVWQSEDYGKRKAGPPACIMTVTLEEAGHRTKWTLVSRFESVAARDAALASGFTTMIEQGSEKLNDIVRKL